MGAGRARLLAHDGMRAPDPKGRPWGVAWGDGASAAGVAIEAVEHEAALSASHASSSI